MDSILSSIKKLLNLGEDDDSFDTDIIMHINSAFSILQQLGVGPDGGFRISDFSTTWGEYLGDENKLEIAKTYIYTKVRLIFDPPTSNAIMEAYKELIKELEFRLIVATEDDS